MKNLQELMRLDGCIALITGGAGHLGQAMAAALAELGCGLCLVDCDPAALDAAEATLGQAWPVPLWTYCADLEDETDRRDLVPWVADRCGRLDILINNAAYGGTHNLEGWVTAFEHQSLATWRRCLEVNLTAAFDLSQGFAPLLRASGQGAIVNIGSIYGVVGPDLGLYAGTAMGNPAAYAASKGGLTQLTRWLATVLAPDIRVNCISPGGVYRQQPEAFVARYLARTPLGRMAVEEDFKGAIAYLASGLSAYVTGQNLMVDGGWTSW
jgi:NAD(P)-dependent dehydrogenase (short-subunit alcohol dehydrogenase family)